MREAPNESQSGEWAISMPETVSADLAVFDSLVLKGAGFPVQGIPNLFSADALFVCNDVLITPFFPSRS
jgi:hypothetical protein